jgi:hypothetical protein
MRLVVTIDVEEEGLFRGRYDSANLAVENVPELARLDPIFQEWGIRPTLLVTYPVARHQACSDLLLKLKEKWHGEIGAHLHHWNTPPIQPLPYADPVPSEMIPRELLAEKLAKLLETINRMGIRPTSFRMGRFNVGQKIFSLLAPAGIEVDSSVAPMRSYYGGPDHIGVSTDPYFADSDDPRMPGNSAILEVPITVVPLTRRLGWMLHQLREKALVPSTWISWFAINLGSLPVQPAWTGLRRLKAATMLHRRRDGQVLTIFFHSSELMPGGYPHHPTAQHVDRFLNRLRGFLTWLYKTVKVESLTLSELGRLYSLRRQENGEPVRRLDS